MMQPSRRGFALIFVLWILVAASAATMAGAAIGRTELGVIGRRIGSERARWAAQGCADRFLAQTEERIWASGFTAASIAGEWSDLDQASVAMPGCTVTLKAAGLSLDVNTASRAQLTRILQLSGESMLGADSLAAAILDWRDADDRAESAGAERDWYLSAGLVPPANRLFTDVKELAHVRGLQADLLAKGILGVQPERILWRRADPAVLGTLPGISDEVLAVFAAHDAFQLSALSAIADFPELSTQARADLVRSSQELAPLVTDRVEAWTLRVTAADRLSTMTSSVTLRLTLEADHIAVVERRVSP